jgi:hypothetical protein
VVSQVHYHVHKSLPKFPVWSQMKSVHSFPNCFFKTHTNIILPSTLVLQAEWTPHYLAHKGNSVCQLDEFAGCMRETPAELIFQTIFATFNSFHTSIFCLKAKITCFCFSSCTGIFLGNTVDWWLKDFGYNETWSQIQLTSIVIMHHSDYIGTCTRENYRWRSQWRLGELLPARWTYAHHNFVFQVTL